MKKIISIRFRKIMKNYEISGLSPWGTMSNMLIISSIPDPYK